MDPVLLLLAEDEPLILLSTQDALEAAGFSIVPAADGAEAMAVLAERHGEIKGLVTDVRLGAGPNGWDVARRARELNPLLPVLYATGDSAMDWPVQGVPKSLVIQKPYVAAQVLTAISTLLTEVASTPLPPES